MERCTTVPLRTNAPPNAVGLDFSIKTFAQRSERAPKVTPKHSPKNRFGKHKWKTQLALIDHYINSIPSEHLHFSHESIIWGKRGKTYMSKDSPKTCLLSDLNQRIWWLACARALLGKQSRFINDCFMSHCLLCRSKPCSHYTAYCDTKQGTRHETVVIYSAMGTVVQRST